MSENRNIKLLILSSSVLLIFFLVSIHFFSKPVFEMILDKQLDRCVFAPVFFVNTLLCLLISLNLYKKKLFFYSVIYFMLFMALFILSLELIHWGQVLFNYETFFFQEKDQIFHQMSISEMINLRSYFYANIVFVGLYGSFLWIFLSKEKVENENRFSKLFVPEGYLFLYFFPIVVLVIGAAFVSYLSYKTHSNFTYEGSVCFDDFLWLFELLCGDIHFFRVFLALGLFIFFFRNLLWIKSLKHFEHPDLRYALKSFLSFLVVLILFNIVFVNIYEKYGVYNLFTANATFFEINKKDRVAITQYNTIVKYNKNDDYVNMKLSLLYHRTGNETLAMKYLTESIFKKLKKNRLIIEMFVYCKKDGKTRHQEVIFYKEDSKSLVAEKMTDLYQDLYTFHLEDTFIQDFTEFIFKSLILGKNRIVVELSV